MLAPWVPSLAVKVTIVVPGMPALGVKRTVRLAPVPATTMFAAGNKLVLLDSAVTVRGAPVVELAPILVLPEQNPRVFFCNQHFIILFPRKTLGICPEDLFKRWRGTQNPRHLRHELITCSYLLPNLLTQPIKLGGVGGEQGLRVVLIGSISPWPRQHPGALQRSRARPR